MLDSRLASRLFSYLLLSLSVDQQACRGHDLWPLEGRAFHTLRLKAALQSLMAIADSLHLLWWSASRPFIKHLPHVSSVRMSFRFMVADPVIKHGLLARYCSV